LEFTVEVWIKGNQITGNFIELKHESTTTIFNLDVSSLDLEINGFIGTPLTFSNALSTLSPTDWNFLGISFGVSGDSTT